MQSEEEHNTRSSQERRQRHKEQRGERRERHQERRPTPTDERPREHREHRDPSSPRSSRRRNDYPTEQPAEQRSSSSADRLQDVRDEEPASLQERELVAEATTPSEEDRVTEDLNIETIETESSTDAPVILTEMTLSASTQERQQSKKDFREQHAALNVTKKSQSFCATMQA